VKKKERKEDFSAVRDMNETLVVVKPAAGLFERQKQEKKRIVIGLHDTKERVRIAHARAHVTKTDECLRVCRVFWASPSFASSTGDANCKRFAQRALRNEAQR